MLDSERSSRANVRKERGRLHLLSCRRLLHCSLIFDRRPMELIKRGCLPSQVIQRLQKGGTRRIRPRKTGRVLGAISTGKDN